MLHIKDQDHDLVVADFVQDPPITGTHSPGPRIPDKLCGLSWPGIVRRAGQSRVPLARGPRGQPLNSYTLAHKDTL